MHAHASVTLLMFVCNAVEKSHTGVQHMGSLPVTVHIQLAWHVWVMQYCQGLHTPLLRR